MFQKKKLKRHATSAIAEVAEVALCASNCALPTSDKNVFSEYCCSVCDSMVSADTAYKNVDEKEHTFLLRKTVQKWTKNGYYVNPPLKNIIFIFYYLT